MKDISTGQQKQASTLPDRCPQAMLEGIAEGVLEICSDRIVYANAAAVSILGIARKDLIGLNPLDFFDHDARSRIAEMLQAASANLLTTDPGSPLALKDRLVTLKIIEPLDSGWNKMMLITDVTVHSRMELELQHARKMEAVGRIASGIAHNFRNTLAGILVNSQVIQMTHQQDADLLKIVERINSSVQRGAQLVDRLLEFSYKQIKKEFQSVDLVPLIRTTHQLIKESFDKRIRIRIDVPPSLPVMGDPSGLSTVLMNLCNNAGSAMPDGGQLSIAAWQQAGKAVLVIADSGLGMDAKTLEKCFDPFFTTKEVGKGTGLGLSTAYGIVKSHNGSIRVRSQLNKGTVFTLAFPLATAGANSSEPAADEKTRTSAMISGRGSKVLIVDDEPDFLNAMAQLLESLDYQPLCASNGPDAIAAYRDERPEIVLMDINMPEMDGITCAKRIMAYDPGARIVIMSGYDADGRYGLKETEKNMFKGYLTKPIGLDALSLYLARLHRNPE